MNQVPIGIVCGRKDCNKQADYWMSWDIWDDSWKFPVCQKHFDMGIAWYTLEDKWRKDKQPVLTPCASRITEGREGKVMFNTGHENLPFKLDDAISWKELWRKIKRRIGKWLEGRVT